MGQLGELYNIFYRRIKDAKICVFVFVSAVKYIYIYRCIQIITRVSKIIKFIHHIIEFVIQKKNILSKLPL